MYFPLPIKNYNKKYGMILDEYIQLPNANIATLSRVLLILGPMMTMMSFLFVTVNSSKGNCYRQGRIQDFIGEFKTLDPQIYWNKIFHYFLFYRT